MRRPLLGVERSGATWCNAGGPETPFGDHRTGGHYDGACRYVALRSAEFDEVNALWRMAWGTKVRVGADFKSMWFGGDDSTRVGGFWDCGEGSRGDPRADEVAKRSGYWAFNPSSPSEGKVIVSGLGKQCESHN